MTLHTKVALRSTTERAVGPTEAFLVIRNLIGAGPDYRTYTREDRETTTVSGQPGHGYPAWIWVEFRPDGQRMAATWISYDGREVSAEQESARTLWEPAADVIVHFDTSYGYRNDRNDSENCNTLHARYILGLRKAFAGAEMEWRDEYSGEWHSDLDGLREFVEDSGAEALAWFDDEVLPILSASAPGAQRP